MQNRRLIGDKHISSFQKFTEITFRVACFSCWLWWFPVQLTMIACMTKPTSQTNAPNFKSKLFNGTINVPSAFMKERIKKRKQIAQSNDSFRAFVFICMADGSRVVRVCNKRYIIHYTYKHLRYEFVGVLTPFIMWNERKIKMSTAYWYSMDKVRRCKMSTVRR